MGHDGIPEGEIAVSVCDHPGQIVGSITRFSDKRDALDFARIFLPGAAHILRMHNGDWEALSIQEVADLAALPKANTADQQKQTDLATGMLSILARRA